MFIFIYFFIIVTSIFMCFSSGMYMYFSIVMYVKHHEQVEIGCGAILNKIYYYIQSSAFTSTIVRFVFPFTNSLLVISTDHGHFGTFTILYVIYVCLPQI